MIRILIAIAATVGFAGIAAAEQAPSLNGNYSANVVASYDSAVNDAATLDMGATASVRSPMPAGGDMTAGGTVPADRTYDIYTGR